MMFDILLVLPRTNSSFEPSGYSKTSLKNKERLWTIKLDY